jgi:hypothetical protein
VRGRNKDPRGHRQTRNGRALTKVAELAEAMGYALPLRFVSLTITNQQSKGDKTKDPLRTVRRQLGYSQSE